MGLMGADVRSHKWNEEEIFRVVEDRELLKEGFPEDAEAEEAVLEKILGAAGQICILKNDWEQKRECFEVDTYNADTADLQGTKQWEMQVDRGPPWETLLAAIGEATGKDAGKAIVKVEAKQDNGAQMKAQM